MNITVKIFEISLLFDMILKIRGINDQKKEILLHGSFKSV